MPAHQNPLWCKPGEASDCWAVARVSTIRPYLRAGRGGMLPGPHTSSSAQPASAKSANVRSQPHHQPRHPGGDPAASDGSNASPGGIMACSSSKLPAARCPGSSRPPSCASVCARAITPAPPGAGIANHASPSGRTCSAAASTGISAGPGSSRCSRLHVMPRVLAARHGACRSALQKLAAHHAKSGHAQPKHRQ